MNNQTITSREVKATVSYIRMSPNKARRVLNQIRGVNLKEALMLLEFMPYRACKVILNLLNSAVANAENNQGMSRQGLIVSKAYANQGPVLKRVQPRAQGRASAIRKPTCHITITVRIQ
uniref:Large ribosomal subunit protein uL22c n=1 Tax=Sciadococcus taiwanensis TaxID=3028030 RepID=A0A9Y1I2C7_9RHOD|nr:ribosomal protein L22 [Sciadococcus taiwanensis]